MIVLKNCEICGKKLSEEEKEKYGHECQECRDHLADMMVRIFGLNDFKGMPNDNITRQLIANRIASRLEIE